MFNRNENIYILTDKSKTCPAAKGWGGCNRRNSCHKTNTIQEKWQKNYEKRKGRGFKF